MKQLSRNAEELSNQIVDVPQEKVIQFGEGNFLRGFVDWMIHKANTAGVYDGSVVVVQPIPHGLVSLVNEQDGLYTMILRGQQNGEAVTEQDLVQSISRGITSHEQWDKVLECATNPAIEVLLSNTTEAGIAYISTDLFDHNPPESFPGKVCVYLHHRFKAFKGDPDKGMLIIPCELIEANGDNLKSIVLRLASEWNLEPAFIDWVQNANTFANSLVDRIVTGYPGKEQAQSFWEQFGYEDQLLNTGELFHLWVIEAPESASGKLPLHKANLNVKWVDDLTPYRTRKVRILNGAHTSTFALAHLAGFSSVKEAIDDQQIGSFLESVIFNEIIRTLDLSQEELVEYAGQVLERFKNPFIHHRWLDISLNSVSKFKARVLPSLLANLEKGNVPKGLALSLAALISFYKGNELNDVGLVARANGQEYTIRDDRSNLEFFFDLWQSAGNDYQVVATKVLGNKEMWDVDLSHYPEFLALVSKLLMSLQEGGVTHTLEDILS